MNKNDRTDSQAPPIPPRRKKHKNNLSTIVNSEPALKPASKPRRKPRLPPPPPPPPFQKAREKRNQFGKNLQHFEEPEPDLENNLLVETKKENNPLIPYKIKFNVGDENRDAEVLQNHFKNQIQNRNASTYNLQSREQNKYPPLLFTFQDFQTVMSESISNRDHQTSLEETFSSKNFIDESKVCFRVTTTNLPFEKCLETWQNSFDNPEFEGCNENLFIFEDYIDRSKRTNARPDLFRMESLENSLEEVVPNRTKVRFVIESPSSSTPDDNAEITMDSLQNIESLNKDLEELQKIQSICEAIQNSEELKCESDEVPFDTLCDGNKLNLDKIDSDADIICEKHVQTGDKEGDAEESKDLSKNNEMSSLLNGMITLNNETISTDEIISMNKVTFDNDHFPEEEANSACLPKLQRYKTYLSSDNFSIQDITEVGNPEEEPLEKPKVAVTNLSKLQSLKNQKSENGSYEDASNFEKLVLEKNIYFESSEDRRVMDLERQNSNNENIAKIQRIESVQESSVRRKIIIDSSLYDIINDDSESNWNEFADEKKAIKSSAKLDSENNAKDEMSSDIHISKLKNSLEIKNNLNPENLGQNSSVPVSVRRNSFLDKMLNEEISCEVIATHPKPDELKSRKEILSTSLELKTIEQEFSALSTSSGEKIVKRSSGFIESKNKDQKKNISEKVQIKSVEEAKYDMLNELLCNFSAIKLKSVASSRNFDRDSCADPINLVNKSACEEKTDEFRVEEGGSASARVTDPSESLASVEDRLASVNKCAIARRSPRTCNNSIDNNAKTPVALSIDQSHDAFSITPGSVRNFIKHYEFQQETSNQCYKDKDKTFKDKGTDFEDRDKNCKKKITKRLLMRDQPEALNQKQEVHQNFPTDFEDFESHDMISRCKSLDSIDDSNPELLTPHGPIGRRQSCIKSNDSSPIPDRKKSVQFDSACTVIQLQKQDESSMSSLINGIRSRIKGKAPSKPEMQMPITFKKSLRSDYSTPEVQEESEAQSTRNILKSGTDYLVHKTENPRNNQTFVFYCKV